MTDADCQRRYGISATVRSRIYTSGCAPSTDAIGAGRGEAGGGGKEIAGDDEREDRFLRLTGQRRVLLLVLIMTAAAVALGCIAVLILYEVAFERDRERLSDLARNMAANIAAISDSLQQSGMSADEARETALRMQTEARSQAHGLGETGEFALAERRGDTIVYRIRDRANPIDKPLILPLKPDAGSQDGPGGAMRRAIAGEAGTVVGLDYQGVPVVTAYEPLPELGAGVVVEINMAELRHPFIRAAIAIGLLGVVLVALGTTLFFRITEPMLWQLRHKERRYRHLVEQMDQGIIVLRAVDEGRDFVIRDMNPAGEAIERQPRDQLIGRRISEVLPAAVAAGMLDLCRAVRRAGWPPACTISPMRTDAAPAGATAASTACRKGTSSACSRTSPPAMPPRSG